MKFLRQEMVGTVSLLSLVLLFSINFVSAAVDTNEVQDVFPIYNVIEYTKPCTNSGTWCSGSTTCNYTFYDKDNSILINNQPATLVAVNGSSLWQYNISHEATGVYKVDMCCIDGADQGCNTMYYQVTGDGLNDSIWFQVIIFAVSAGVIVFGFGIKDGWITIFGTFGLYFVGLYTLFYGIGGVKDTVYTWAIGLIVLGLAGYISINAAMEMMSE